MDLAVRIGERRIVEDVVGLGAKLELHPLRDAEVLEETKVRRVESGTVELIACHVAGRVKTVLAPTTVVGGRAKVPVK